MSVKWGGCFFTLLLILTGLASVRAQISDLRLCADPECKEPISKGRSVIGYPSNDKQILSFPINAEVTVYSKEAGSRQDLWGAEIKGKRGYVPKQYIREQKVFVSKPKYEVPTEGTGNVPVSAADNGESDVVDSTKGNNPEAEVENEQTETEEEEIALSAEDVEYNRLKKASLENPHRDPHKEGVNVHAKEEVKDETVVHDNVENEQHPEDDGKDEEEDINDDDADEHVEEENEAEKEVDDDLGEGESKDTKPAEQEVEQPLTEQEVEQPLTEQEVEQPLTEQELEQPMTEQQEEKESEDATAKQDSNVDSSEHSSSTDTSIIDEPAPANYEVIDGTTLYFDDTTPLPATEEVLPPVNLMSSSVSEENYATAHPSPLLPQASHEEQYDPSSNIQATSTLMPETNTAIIMESGSEGVTEEPPVEPTETLPSEKEKIDSSKVEAEQSVEPTSSWLSDATASVTSWFENENENEEGDEKHPENEKDFQVTDDPLSEVGEEEEEEDLHVDEDEDNGEFGFPKEESIIDGAEILDDEEEKQNDGGFFSSWFGSSEEPKDEVDEATENSGSENSDDTVDPDANVEHDSATKDIIAEASKADPVDSPVPSDTIPIPVVPTESPAEILAQLPYAAADVDNAYSTQHSTPPSVDTIPQSPSTSDQDQNVEIPLDPDEMDPSVQLSTEGLNDQADITKDTDDDEDDPGTSTARPLYAEPEPSSHEYSPDGTLDHDEISRLAGKGLVGMDGSESSEGETAAEGSLSEELLKTSHNLLPEGLAFGFEAEFAEPHVSNGMLVFLLIVAGTVVTIYFVHLVMMKISREAPLLEALNRIDRENRMKADESESLHSELLKARAELENVSSRVTTSSGDVDEITSQLELVKESLAQVTEIAMVTEQQLLQGQEEELLAQRDVLLPASVDHLQSMLDGQREKVETLTSDLALKNRLNEELHSELSASMERASKLDYQVEQDIVELTHSLEDLTGVKGEAIRKLQEEAALVEELKEANSSLTQQAGDYDSKVNSLNAELNELRDSINQLRESVETKESELQVAKECLKQLRRTSSDDSAAPDEEKLSALFDVIRVKAELHKVNNERLNLVDQLQDAEMAQKNLEDTMASIRTEVAELRTHHDVAIREKQEAMSKLEVLTKYFEEKEAQLTKELESQEGLRVDAEGSAAAVSRKIQNYDLELASYKKMKQHQAYSEGKLRKHYQKPPDVVNLSDLSPTTANVPMSDEYKVEWVKAKAEMKRRKSSASSTDRSDKTSPTPSGVTSTGSSRQSTDSPACPSDSSLNIGDSPARPQRRKDKTRGVAPSRSTISATPSESNMNVVPPESSTVPSQEVMFTSLDRTKTLESTTSEASTSSPPRPSSLTVLTRSHPVSVVYSESRPSVFHRTVSPIDRVESLQDDQSTVLPTTVEREDSLETENKILEGKLTIPRLYLDDDVSESVKDSPASDDFKSSVAAIRSFYEKKKDIILSQSRPGYRFRTQVESLRKELEEQEASYKTQIASHEQKAHDNWLQARASERKHDEQRQENSQLRGRLTMLQKEKEDVQQSQVNIIKPTPKRKINFGKLKTFWQSVEQGQSTRHISDSDSSGNKEKC